jgi:serine/threonine-protein kinase HipA
MTEGQTKILRRAAIFQSGILAGHLEEVPDGGWSFVYVKGYVKIPISLTLPVRKEPYVFETFPAVLDGLLPEGEQLNALLKKQKIDRNDCFTQLVTVGQDLVGSLSVCQVEVSIPETQEV